MVVARARVPQSVREKLLSAKLRCTLLQLLRPFLLVLLLLALLQLQLLLQKRLLLRVPRHDALQNRLVGVVDLQRFFLKLEKSIINRADFLVDEAQHTGRVGELVKVD